MRRQLPLGDGEKVLPPPWLPAPPPVPVFPWSDTSTDDDATRRRDAQTAVAPSKTFVDLCNNFLLVGPSLLLVDEDGGRGGGAALLVGPSCCCCCCARGEVAMRRSSSRSRQSLPPAEEEMMEEVLVEEKEDGLLLILTAQGRIDFSPCS